MAGNAMPVDLSCHFERSEKSLSPPKGEIARRSLAFARDDIRIVADRKAQAREGKMRVMEE
jgi:hypothetical protein